MKNLEEKMNLLEFKLELLLRLSYKEFPTSFEECKSLYELAFTLNLSKEQFANIETILASQIDFYKSIRQKSYLGPRQLPKIDDDVDVFLALSKEEFENVIWDNIPNLNHNETICIKIAKLSGIYEIYYEELAQEIKGIKFERLDKENKLLNIYNEYQKYLKNNYQDLYVLKEEFHFNIMRVNEIINFFDQNELQKISIFYNGELWEKAEDDKHVVINEESYIQNVCKIEKNQILDEISELLKGKCPYKELLIYLLKSGTKSSMKIDQLKTFYQNLEVYNKNEYVDLVEMKKLHEELEKHLKKVDELLTNYEEYLESIKQK